MLLALPASAVLVAATILLSAAIRWLVLPRLQPGRWSVFSRVYYRKWLTNQIQESSLHVLHGLYATVFAPFWYRVLGAHWQGAEISTAMGVVPDMLTLGDDTLYCRRGDAGRRRNRQRLDELAPHRNRRTQLCRQWRLLRPMAPSCRLMC